MIRKTFFMTLLLAAVSMSPVHAKDGRDDGKSGSGKSGSNSGSGSSNSGSGSTSSGSGSGTSVAAAPQVAPLPPLGAGLFSLVAMGASLLIKRRRQGEQGQDSDTGLKA